MKRQTPALRDKLLRLFAYIVACGALVFLMTFRLGSLFTGGSTHEISAITNVTGPEVILSNPLHASHKLLLAALQMVTDPSLLVSRMISVGFGIAAIWLFYALVRSRFSARISAFGTLIFATSTTVVAITRNAGFYSSTMFAACAMLLAMQLLVTPRGFTAKGWLIGGLIAAALFSPGAPIVLLIAAIWHAPRLAQIPRYWPAWSLLSIFAFPVAALGLLTYGFVQNINLLQQWLALPSDLPTTSVFMQNFSASSQMLFSRAPILPEFIVGRTPILDIFTAVCFILGLAYAQRHTTLWGFGVKLLLIMAGLAYGSLSSADNLLPLALPIAYLGVTAGVTFLLRQWLSIFPRNPVARTIGVAAMTAVIGVSCYYQLSRFYIAFSQTPENRRAYTQQLPAAPEQTTP